MSAAKPATEESPDPGLDLTGLLPDLFERYFAFFRPGHREGIVPSRVKELARLKVAALNGCDT
jgi:hypothetical protein